MAGKDDAVARRLRAMKLEFGWSTDEAFARFIGAQRTAVSNWMNGRLLPPVAYMVKLKGPTKVTLDWIYTGDSAGMPMGLAIRLEGHLEGLSPPDAAPDPKPSRVSRENPRAAAGGSSRTGAKTDRHARIRSRAPAGAASGGGSA